MLLANSAGLESPGCQSSNQVHKPSSGGDRTTRESGGGKRNNAGICFLRLDSLLTTIEALAALPRQAINSIELVRTDTVRLARLAEVIDGLGI